MNAEMVIACNVELEGGMGLKEWRKKRDKEKRKNSLLWCSVLVVMETTGGQEHVRK